MDFLNQYFWGNSLPDWLLAILIFILSLLGIRIIQNILHERLMRSVYRIPTDLDERNSRIRFLSRWIRYERYTLCTTRGGGKG